MRVLTESYFRTDYSFDWIPKFKYTASKRKLFLSDAVIESCSLIIATPRLYKEKLNFTKNKLRLRYFSRTLPTFQEHLFQGTTPNCCFQFILLLSLFVTYITVINLIIFIIFYIIIREFIFINYLLQACRSLIIMKPFYFEIWTVVC